MYASLDRVDIMSEGEGGRPWYIQTDHRAADEIEQTAELSTVFALLRILNARRLADSRGEDPLLLYVMTSPPPAFLSQAIAAAGGRVQIGRGAPEQLPANVPALDELLQAAFAALAQRTADDNGVPVSIDGLADVETALAADPISAEEDEIAYWTTVVSLGALGGEVIRAANGGRWAAGGRGTLPVALSTSFNGDEKSLVNPLGKAIKLLANGEEDSLVYLVRLVTSKP
ncbi:MAG TPA: hypothetical protein VD886_01365 [Herpetosiphonaceae bacterium]|nr:hypothetical protein [Herpetosiphonaceae bacterium]